METKIGQWNPMNKFRTVFNIMDNMCDQVDDLDDKTISSVGKRARELTKGLNEIVQGLSSMQEIDYNKTKITFLIELTKKAIEQSEYLVLVIERMECVKRINEQAVAVDSRLKQAK